MYILCVICFPVFVQFNYFHLKSKLKLFLHYCINYFLLEYVDCFTPPQVANGVVLYKATYYGSVANYYCILPHVVVGNPNITCQGNGVWEIAPRCSKLYPILISTVLVMCPFNTVMTS